MNSAALKVFDTLDPVRYFANWLNALREGLVKDRRSVDQLRTCNVRPSDPLDQSVQDHQQDLDVEFHERGFDQLKQIDKALGRLDSGTYGLCTICDDLIPVERLEAMPTTEHCRDCQREKERLFSADKARPNPLPLLTGRTLERALRNVGPNHDLTIDLATAVHAVLPRLMHRERRRLLKELESIRL